MKINTPVTGREVPVPRGECILSTTTTRGIITYADETFCRIAKFSLDELIGKPHNIVRHPDMPPLAFEDLWKTIKGGKSWFGLVKNRCKDGDHYWVDAYVTPILENGEISEYQSVRIHAEEDCVRRAEEIYGALGRKKTDPIPERFLPPKRNLKAKIRLALAATVLATALPFLLPLPLAVDLSLALLLGVWTGTRLLGKAMAPIHEVVDEARTIYQNPIAQYVYTGRTDEAGAIRLAFKALRMQAIGVLGRVDDISKAVLKSATSVRESAVMTNERSKAQNEQTQQMAAAMEELSVSAKSVADNTRVATEDAQESESKAEEGLKVLRRTERTVKELAESVNQIAGEIGSLVQENSRIHQALEIINEIAEQIKLLALNATLEATRAGEHGKGFAIVAQEIRTLAKHTEEATSDIADILKSLQQKAEGSQALMSSSTDIAHQSVDKMNEGMESFDGIRESVEKILQMNQVILTSTNEQSEVTEDMAQRIVSISSAARDLDQQAEALTRNGEKLVETSKHMGRLVEQFWLRA